MKQTIAYVRVSTQDQGDNGIGMDLQEAQIRKFAEVAGYTIKKVFNEAASAGGEKNLAHRPELKAALNLCKRKKWPLIVASVDRFTRQAEDLVRLVRDDGVQLIVAELGERGDYVTILAQGARSQRERELIGEFTKAKLDLLKAQGVKLGNTTNLPEAREKAVAKIKRKAGLRLDEFERAWSDAYKRGATETAEGLARYLNGRGVLTAQGRPWTAPNVRRMLRKAEQKPIPQSLAQSDAEEVADFYKNNPLFGLF